MAPPRSGDLFLFFLCIATLPPLASCWRVILGEPFIFPAMCHPGDSGTRLVRVLLVGGDTREVATCQSGEWTASSGYKDRIKINSSQIALSPTYYNDEGAYELWRNPEQMEPIPLEVVFAHEVSVTVGAPAATLRCHLQTTGETGSTPRWEKNGKLLCLENLSAGGCNGTSGGRFFVSSKWSTHGDLSLTVKDVQLEDRGDYCCYLLKQDGKKNFGNHAAYRLDVKEETPNQMTTATPQTHSWKEKAWEISTIVLGVIVGLIVLAALFIYWCRDKLGSGFGKRGKVKQNGYHPPQPGEATTSV